MLVVVTWEYEGVRRRRKLMMQAELAAVFAIVMAVAAVLLVVSAVMAVVLETYSW